MTRPVPNDAYLQTLINVRLAVGIVRAILAEDDALAALSWAGASDMANITVREFAKPFLTTLEDFLNGTRCQLQRDEQKVVIGVVLNSVRHAIKIFRSTKDTENDARIAAAHTLDLAWHLLSVASKAEIGIQSIAAGHRKPRRSA
jgi:hypothetical protein